MNRIFPQTLRLLAGLGALLLVVVGGILLAPSSTQAVSLPPGEYDFLNIQRPVPFAKGEKDYSPYAGQYEDSYPRQVFWGDTHLHTAYSFDAATGGTTLTPEDSYRFARGEEVKTDEGQKVQLSRPLDFLVVSDHTDQLGSFQQLMAKEEPPEDCDEKDEEQIYKWYKMIQDGEEVKAKQEISSAFAEGEAPECLLQTPLEYRTAWTEEVDWAEKFNEPYKFTAIIGYEWTALDAGDNLHRNVIFRDGGDKAKQLLPKTTLDGPDPELLWQWMDTYETLTGGKVLAIPHNGNLSNGQMFADSDARGQKLTLEYAAARQRWEPLYEVTQIKGTTETNETLSPDDDFAGFETAGWMYGNLNLSVPKKDEMFEHEYARAALKNGLKFEGKLAVNPFKFGLVGSSDSHIALSAVEENSYMGKLPYETPHPDRAAYLGRASSFNKTRILDLIEEEKVPPSIKEEIEKIIPDDIDPDAIKQKVKDELIAREIAPDSIPPILSEKLIPEVERFGWQHGAAGYVGVWAEANTRESLFDAMKRREVYATSGPRMVVRLFGGWDFTPDDLDFDPGKVGYAKGVPMGGDLNPIGAVKDKSPTFLVAAMKDPLRANLDRIQIVKGWLDADGNTHEQVYDVAWSDDRVRDPDTGKLPPVGSVVNPEITDPATDPGTVDTETATWTDTIGDTELATVWTDPEFEPSQLAFYYARVLEIPTPRWTDYDKAFYGRRWCLKAKLAKNDPKACDDIPLTLQERVYTSPIWYSPA